MSKRPTYRSEQEDFEKYFGDELSDKERHDLESHALEDVFEAEAMEGWGEVPVDTAQTDLTELREKLQPATPNQFNWLKIAAAVALLIVASVVVLTNIYEEPELLAQDSKMEEAPVQETESAKLEATTPVEEEQSPAPIPEEPIANDAIETVINAPAEDGLLAAADSNEPDAALIDPPKIDAPVLQSISQVSDDQAVAALDVSEMDIVESDTEVPVRILAAEGLDQRAVQLRKESAGYEVAAGDYFKVQSKGDWSFRQIQGNVMDENGQIVSDARIVLNGTPILAVSDFKGQFEMAIPDSLTTPTLIFSSAGFNQLNYEINALDTFDVVLARDDQSDFTNSLVGSPAATSRSAKRSTEDVELETYDNSNSIVARPDGGYKKFEKYLKKNAITQRDDNGKKITGKVVLSLSLGASGNYESITVLESLDESVDKEAIRLIRQGPIWIPATRNGTFVSSEVEVTVTFN